MIKGGILLMPWLYVGNWGTLHMVRHCTLSFCTCISLAHLTDLHVCSHNQSFSLSLPGAQSIPGGTFPPGSGTIGITDAQCTGSESSLSNCTYTRVALNSTCLHQNDAGVICALPCINGSVQIVGPSSNLGHVQACVDSDWVSVCANKWTTADANMVCSELGFTIQGTCVYHTCTYLIVLHFVLVLYCMCIHTCTCRLSLAIDLKRLACTK